MCLVLSKGIESTNYSLGKMIKVNYLNCHWQVNFCEVDALNIKSLDFPHCSLSHLKQNLETTKASHVFSSCTHIFCVMQTLNRENNDFKKTAVVGNICLY